MTSGAARALVAVAVAATLLALGAALALPARAQAAEAPLLLLHRGQFCETEAPFAAAGCTWAPVTLPHRWTPAQPGLSWGLYRFEVPHPGAGAFAVAGERISLNASVRAGRAGDDASGQWVAATPVDASPGSPGGRPALVRYWPQLYPFELPSAAAPGVLRIEVAVQGHDSVKSGVGALAVGALAPARQWHWRETLLEVDLVLALSAATLITGLAGLFAGASRSQPGRLLLVFAGLAIVAALRTAMNYIVAPPLPLAWWTALNVWLLILVALLTCTGVGLYLWPSTRTSVALALGAAGGSALVLALLPGRALYPAAEVMLGLLALLGSALLVLLVARVWRSRDSLGTLLLVALLMILSFGVYDLLVHLGPASLSDRYLQKWSTPALVILMIALLARRVAVQRALESALQREMASREELLRDLHDGVGSRLVALAFHARQQGDPSSLETEIQGLIHELQVIQRAVRAGPTSLGALLADLRHLYARVGGGRLPLHWELADEVGELSLTATQAVATLRILEEAIANAMKHAQPGRVTVRLEPGAGACAAVLSVVDDGVGAFRPGPHGGLHNIQYRAARAGLGLELQTLPEGKAVRILVPAPERRRGSVWERLRARLAGPATSRAPG